MAWLVAIVLVLAASLGVWRGAPFMPAKKRQIEAAFDLLNLKPGAVVYDMGCGIGSALNIGAQRGLVMKGVEINPILAAIAKLRFLGNRRVSVSWGDMWHQKLPADAAGIYVFGITRIMPRILGKVRSDIKRPIKLVSVSCQIQGIRAAKSRHFVYLYEITPDAKM